MFVSNNNTSLVLSARLYRFFFLYRQSLYYASSSAIRFLQWKRRTTLERTAASRRRVTRGPSILLLLHSKNGATKIPLPVALDSRNSRVPLFLPSVVATLALYKKSANPVQSAPYIYNLCMPQAGHPLCVCRRIPRLSFKIPLKSAAALFCSPGSLSLLAAKRGSAAVSPSFRLFITRCISGEDDRDKIAPISEDDPNPIYRGGGEGFTSARALGSAT